ncbi:MAG: HAD-IB family phosphatase [Proteobacteria bacterium]|nr:HAD-IB family phosphatase [Pseudomonadota bacterium]
MDQRKIALFDIDKTIYNGYLIFPLAEYFLKEHIISKDIVDNLYQDLHLYRSKHVDYETSVEHFNMHMAYGLKDHSFGSILSATATFLETEEGSNFFPFAEPLIELLEKTYDIYLITGEMQFVGKAVADYFSVHGYISTEMEVENVVFTGNISKSLAKKEGKRDAVEDLFCVYPYKDSLAFGDSEGDIAMLNKVANAFCINATEGLREVALSRGWHIVTPMSIIEAVKKVL